MPYKDPQKQAAWKAAYEKREGFSVLSIKVDRDTRARFEALADEQGGKVHALRWLLSEVSKSN